MGQWIWKFGDFEIYHNLLVHNRRQQYGYPEPPVWKLYTPEPVEPYFAPVLSFNIKEANSEAVAQRLNAAGIAVRAGLHCAPRAHESFGTLQQGAVRVCPSAFNNMNEIRAFSNTVMKIHRK